MTLCGGNPNCQPGCRSGNLGCLNGVCSNVCCKPADCAAAKRAGFKRLLTESEERNEPMQRLNEKLGFVPAPEWSTVVIRGPLA